MECCVRILVGSRSRSTFCTIIGVFGVLGICEVSIGRELIASEQGLIARVDL
jgi:hypothetical protein